MKTIQKLEVTFGLITLVAAIIYICICIFSNIDLGNQEQGYIALFSKIFLFIIFPSLLTAIGSYIHAVKRRQVGFVMLFFGTSFLTLFFGLFFILAVFYYQGMINGWFAIVPAICAATTMILSLRSRKLFAFPH